MGLPLSIIMLGKRGKQVIVWQVLGSALAVYLKS
jgi:hypothetical protein